MEARTTERLNMPKVGLHRCYLGRTMSFRLNILYKLLLPANEVWGKVMFFTCLSVILFTEKGVCTPACNGVCSPQSTPYTHSPGRHTPLGRHTPPRSTPHPFLGRHPAPRWQLKWAVHILLECNLVVHISLSSLINIKLSQTFLLRV